MALNELIKRRRWLGYSQEAVAKYLKVDRTTVGRWERGETAPQAHYRPKLAALLDVEMAELDRLLTPPPEDAELPRPTSPADPGDLDDMIRREFLRLLALTGSMAMLPPGLTQGGEDLASHEAMNGHLWQVYQLARTKGSVRPLVRDQLSTLSEAFACTRDTPKLCILTADLFQLAGELAFDADRYTEAAQCYTLAMSAAREAGAYDLWACSLTRHAYVSLYERKHGDAAQMLSAAASVAQRGDSALATRHWVAAVQAQAYAGMNDLDACQRALDIAEEVQHLPADSSNGGWLRFDGSRLAEERGARYVELGRLDLAENALTDALRQAQLAKGSSYRRRGAVLADLATIGARRQDIDQALDYGHQALDLAKRSGSGYIARRLQSLRSELGPVARDVRVSELNAEIAALT